MRLKKPYCRRIKIAHAAVTTRTVEDSAVLLSVLASPVAREGEFQADYTSVFGTTKRAFEKTVETFYSLAYTTACVDAPLDFPEFDVKNIDEDRGTISNRLFKDVDVLILPTTNVLDIAHAFQQSTKWHLKHPVE